MATDEEIWNEDGTPTKSAVEASRAKLREILRDEYDWNEQEIENFMSKSQKNEGND